MVKSSYKVFCYTTWDISLDLSATDVMFSSYKAKLITVVAFAMLLSLVSSSSNIRITLQDLCEFICVLNKDKQLCGFVCRNSVDARCCAACVSQ